MSLTKEAVLVEAAACDPDPQPQLLLEWESPWRAFLSAVGPALGRGPQTRGEIGPLFFAWEPRWQGFRSALRPALGPSERALQGECQAGHKHGGSTALAVALHVAALLVVLALPGHILRSEQLLAANPSPQYQIIYYAGEALPSMDDAGGAMAGVQGRAGGRERFHAEQVIRVARGNRALDVVADAPKLKLALSKEAVANLLSVTARGPGPAPAATIHAVLPAAGLQAQPVPPAPKIQRERLAAPPDLVAGAVQAPPQARRQVAGLRMPDLGTAQAVPPPVSAPPQGSLELPKLAMPVSLAVAPPPQVGRMMASVGVPGFGAQQDVVPPAPRVGGAALAGNGIPGGLGELASVAPPAPSFGAGGLASDGAVAGAVKAFGSVLGAAKGASGGGASAVVISANPGTGVGMPSSGGAGSLAMSPSGTDQVGLGGAGGGRGIGRGTGSGSGSVGAGPGSATAGSGPGNSALRAGISVAPGTGGSGAGTGAGIEGVAISGGKVTIPGFSGPAGREVSSSISRGPKKAQSFATLTVIASPRAGGAFNLYGALKGGKVYTIYINTRAGTAVLQYTARGGDPREFQADLTPPEPLNSELPQDWPHSRLVLACTVDKSGLLKDVRILQSARAGAAAKMIAALQSWQFHPAMRGEEPVAVDAILGFDVDTR